MSSDDPTVQRPAVQVGSGPTEPNLVPSEDDIARRRTRRAAPAPRATGGPGPVLYAVIVILIAGVAGAGWFIAHQQEALEASQVQLARAGDRLEQLERRLNLTSENLTQGEAETQNQLQFWEDEIRKLWDVANKRNRRWITENQEVLAKQGETLKGVARDLRNLSASVERHEEVLGTQQQVLEQLADLDNRLVALAEQQAEVQRSLRDLTDLSNATQQTLQAFKSSTERSLREHDQAIQSIDAWRLTVNKALFAPGSGGGAPAPGQ